MSQSATIDVPLIRGEAGWYTAKFHLGTPCQELNLALDTFSEYMVVNSELCVHCDRRTFA